VTAGTEIMIVIVTVTVIDVTGISLQVFPSIANCNAPWRGQLTVHA
jgi:hypothetical protein